MTSETISSASVNFARKLRARKPGSKLLASSALLVVALSSSLMVI
jgi:hypothetical protein